MDDMLDSLLEADMIEKVPVSEGPRDFLFEAFFCSETKRP